MITAEKLFDLAHTAEEKLAWLYEELAKHMTPAGKEDKFFRKMASQEHIHAAWVDEMRANVDPEYAFEELSTADFEIPLSTVDDVHDEVMNNEIKLHDALEIIVHLEMSTAEEFYRLFPQEIPGMPAGMVERMVRSCEHHAKMVQEFADACTD